MKSAISCSLFLLAVLAFGLPEICVGQESHVEEVILGGEGGGGVRGIGGGDNVGGSNGINKEDDQILMLEAELHALQLADQWIMENWALLPENEGKTVLGVQQSDNCPGNVVATWHAEDGVYEYWMYVVYVRYQIDEN